MENLEYMENTSCSNNTEAEAALFFPSLKSLTMINMRRLKGWRKEEGFIDTDLLRESKYRFPCLHELKIEGCSSLTWFPPCPSLEELGFLENNEKLQIVVKIAHKEDGAGTSSQDDYVKLRHAKVDHLGCLKSLPNNGFTSPSIVTDVSEECQNCASSLRTLTIHHCKNLRRLSGLERLTILEELTLECNEQLSISEDDQEPWKSLSQSLRSLKFRSLPNMTSLPKGMKYLTSLQSLSLEACENVRALPEWINCLSSLQSLYIGFCPALISLPQAMRNLTSLKSLEIEECPKLEERCKEPNGEHWPKIQHIPHRNIGWWSSENLAWL